MKKPRKGPGAGPLYFESPAAWRAWLKRNHASAVEVVVGYHKVHTGRPSLTWPESVDEALCFGWIDGVRRRLDAERYVIRFTPRRKGSAWSAINIRKMAALEAAGRMMAAGRAAFAARPRNREAEEGYTYKERHLSKPLSREMRREFRKSGAAWAFFEQQPPGYRRLIEWWVMSAKREETREKRLRRAIEWSGRGKRLGW